MPFLCDIYAYGGGSAALSQEYGSILSECMLCKAAEVVIWMCVQSNKQNQGILKDHNLLDLCSPDVLLVGELPTYLLIQ